MKRPQFSLKLMLLVVALFGVLLGYKLAKDREYRANASGEIGTLKVEIGKSRLRLAELERYLEQPEQTIPESADLTPEKRKSLMQVWQRSRQTKDNITANQIDALESKIADLQDKIDELSK